MACIIAGSTALQAKKSRTSVRLFAVKAPSASIGEVGGVLYSAEGKVFKINLFAG